MRRRSLAPTPDCYGGLILARLEMGEVGRALRVCQSALSAAAPPPVEVVQPLVAALSREGLSGSALELLTELRHRHGILAGGGLARQSLIEAAAGSAASLEAVSVFHELRWHSWVGAGGTGGGGEGVGTNGGSGRVQQQFLQDEMMLGCLREQNVPAAWALLQQLEGENSKSGRHRQTHPPHGPPI